MDTNVLTIPKAIVMWQAREKYKYLNIKIQDCGTGLTLYPNCDEAIKPAVKALHEGDIISVSVHGLSQNGKYLNGTITKLQVIQ